MKNKKDKISSIEIAEWLEEQIEILEYPIGSIGITRNDRYIAIKNAKKALWHIKNLQGFGF